ncbi:hypothetical protein [Methanofollis fontis]|uniref:DUF2127 domain-containing protein n=1 Tax=Methanofollis fontis TaxID=2052832 RepID=A0A483CZF2_9EURY|nr:hypothetical protein [Methanofollis fontis]TAJ45469.1 hypothetical protein CUJ86_01690 [Methanofollis fontis]
MLECSQINVEWPYPAVREYRMTDQRPIGITILAILALLAAIQAIIFTFQMLDMIPIIIGEVAFFTFSLYGAIMWGILAFIYLWVFQMLWNLNPQGWMFVMIVSILNLIMAVFSIIGASSWQAMAPAILINAIVLVYCLMPGTKAAFGLPE